MLIGALGGVLGKDVRYSTMHIIIILLLSLFLLFILSCLIDMHVIDGRVCVFFFLKRERFSCSCACCCICILAMVFVS